MALKLDKELENGVIGNYWRVMSYSSNKKQDDNPNHMEYSVCNVGLYLTKAARNNKKAPLLTYQFRYPETRDEPIVSLLQTDNDWYTYLKTLPEFVGATDI